MSDGKKLITAVLETGSVEFLRTASDDVFEDDELPLFHFVKQHYREYGALPAIGTVEREMRIRLPRAEEPVAYYMQRVNDRKLFVIIREEFGSMRDALQAFDLKTVKDVVDRMKSACRTSSTDNDLRNAQEAARLVMAQYDYAHDNPGMAGIPTGWDHIDHVTGGYQRGDLVAWVARMGVGKCMAPHTPVMLSDGSIVRIDSVRPGMQLMGPDSLPRNILTTNTGREEMFRVIPQHGEEWECNRSHILSLVCANTIDNTHTKGEHYLYTVGEFLQLPRRVQANLRLWRAPVDFPEKETVVDPYLVGLWLGDGTNGYARISTVDTEIAEYLQGYADRLGYRLVQYEKREGFCPTYGIVDTTGRDNYLTAYFTRRCFYGGEKRIPSELLRNTRKVRLLVLAGLVDTDGCLEASGHYEIVTKYIGLRDDMLYLARSLGFGATYGRKEIDGHMYWRVRIRPTEDIPVLLPRKQGALVDRRSRVDWSSFSVESLGQGDYFGITLDGDHLYLLGDFTVTHNTYSALYQAMSAWRLGYSVLMVTMEMTIEQIMRRAIGMQQGINPDFLRRGAIDSWQMRRVKAYINTMAHADRFNLYAGSFAKKTLDVEVLVHELSPDIVFIDGAYLMQPTTAPRNASRIEKVAGVYDDLKRLTITSDRPIVTTSQFSRQSGKRGKEGSLETISFTDAIGMHASLVFSLRDGNPPFEKSRRVVEILKGREGESGEFQTYYSFAPMRFDAVPKENITAEAINLDWQG